MAEDKRDLDERRAEEHEDRGGEHEAQVVTARRGFFPVVYGDKVEVSQGGGVIFLAKDEVEIEQGGGQWMIGLRKAELERGGCGVMVGGRAEVSRSVVGVLVALRSEFKDGSRVLLTLPQALAAGVAAGAILALARWWGGNRRAQGTTPSPVGN